MQTDSNIQPIAAEAVIAEASDRGPHVWGLDAVDLHDAWWRGRGVQCVHLGRPFKPLPGAELYLLAEPDQIATFSLADIMETIVWSHADTFRIRIIERADETYKEEVVRDVEGEVVGIRRRYARDERVGHRVVLTTDPDKARLWAAESTRRDAVRRVIEAADRRVARLRVYGHSFAFELPEGRRRFLDWLVATWEDPDRVLEGLAEPIPGVFAAAGTRLPEDFVCLAPAWLGGIDGLSSQQVVVGPDVLPDEPGRGLEDAGIRVRDIDRIPGPGGRARSGTVSRRATTDLVKRTFDVCFSLAVLVGLSPVILLVAIAVAIDDGFPLFFGHVRQKREGAEFRCWKFRTMRRDAEAMVAQLQAMNKADGPQVFIENDPRVTRVGHVLRKLQLDELPQFWNVLKGDMSVVGPRPSPDKENQFCPAWRDLRLSVRPGITGLWQVERTRAPGQDFQEWIKYDIEYVRRASFVFDLWIIGKTVWNIVRR